MKNILVGCLLIGSITAHASRCEITVKGIVGNLNTVTDWVSSVEDCNLLGTKTHEQYLPYKWYSGKSVMRFWNDDSGRGKADKKIVIKY
jgi:hypothetical protein